MLLGATLAWAAPADYEGKLRATEIAPLPEGATMEIRPLEPADRNALVEALLTEALKTRGHGIEKGAPIIMAYKASGIFTQVKDDTSWLQMQGAGGAGSASGAAGMLSLTLSDTGGDKDKPRTYQLELRAETAQAKPLWEAYAVLDSKSSDIGQTARHVVGSTLDRMGRSYFGPLLR